MTTTTHFKPETIDTKLRCIRFKAIKAVFETMTIKEHIPEYVDPKARITSPEHIWEMFKFLRHETKEHFYTLHVDGKNRIMCIDRVSTGSLNQSIVHPRETFKSALLSSAAAIILLHNHPSGETTPSREDIEITRRLKEAGELLGIKVLDHIIIGETYLSFTAQGML